MSLLFRSSPRNPDLALLIVRVAAGIVFLAHGAQKLFTMGLAGTEGMFTTIGAPAPRMTAPLITFIELLGGLAFIGGLLTRLAALGLVADMIGAILIVHLSHGLTGQGGFEFPLTLLAISLAIMVSGAGRYSIDAVIADRTKAS